MELTFQEICSLEQQGIKKIILSIQDAEKLPEIVIMALNFLQSQGELVEIYFLRTYIKYQFEDFHKKTSAQINAISFVKLKCLLGTYENDEKNSKELYGKIIISKE